MAKMDTEDFTGNIISVVIAVIVIGAVAVPIITGLVGEDVPASGTPGTEGYVPAKDFPIDAGTTIATIVEILPVFLVLAVLMMIVYLFISKKN